ncbi:hypothetical protein [Streptomyces fumanus]|uniref:Uncharacterized protein n=1 Tax=Streptomyces fumanus TaxID=67302 RepID=A0A919E0U3_9ACTN|nr:hypothetical protein [Streptomyces fumanus]GHE98321.1 hypothetical protein GCM10018772_23430 [Streptomyces fumanus]
MTPFTHRLPPAYRTLAAITVAGAALRPGVAPSAFARTPAASSTDGPDYVALGDS